MLKTETPTYLYLNQIYIKQLVLDEAEYVTIFGYIFDTTIGDLKDWDYVVPINVLTDLLLLANEKGDKVIKEISEIIIKGIKPPEVIDVQSLLGHTLKINNICICASEPKVQREGGNWELTDESCYIIDSVISF